MLVCGKWRQNTLVSIDIILTPRAIFKKVRPCMHYEQKGYIVCYYQVTYAFQRESTLYSCLNVNELLARNRRDIWSLSDSNGNHNHLVFVYEVGQAQTKPYCLKLPKKLVIFNNNFARWLPLVIIKGLVA